MKVPSREWLAWAVPGAIVLGVSVVLTLRAAGPGGAADVPRFSGSSVVATMPPLLVAPTLPGRPRVAVIRDAAAAEYYRSPAVLDSIVRGWRDALTAVGADARIVSSAQLSRGIDARVLVVPASPCLSVATREAIERAGARGQGLVVTGAVGTHDAGCRRIGYGLLVALTGAMRVAVLDDRPTVNVVVPDRGPLSLDVPPGARIDLHPSGQVALRGGTRDAVYGRYDLRPAPVDGSPLLDGALSRASYRGARVVYWGFELGDVVDRPWNREVRALLVRNAVAWAGGVPQAAVEPWPGDRRSAVVLAQDVDGPIANARYAADSLGAAGVPGTFFVDARSARRERRLVQRLASVGEVASHTESYALLGGQPADVQEKRLREAAADLADLVGAPARGLRPPGEQFDRATMAGWLAAGGTYLFGVNDARAAAPELLGVGGDTLVLLPRTAADDRAALPTGTFGAGSALARFADDFAHVQGLGGLYTLSYHAEHLGRREHVPVLARLARELGADPRVWIATAADVAGWWRARSALEVRARREATGRLELSVRNGGKDAVAGAVVRVTLPPSRRVTGSHARLLPADPGMARVLVPLLVPGDSFAVSLELGAERDP